MMNDTANYLSKEKFDELTTELEHLKTVRRREIAELRALTTSSSVPHTERKPGRFASPRRNAGNPGGGGTARPAPKCRAT